MDSVGLLHLAVVAFGAFALLAPRSPVTLALLRARGPRLEHEHLLRSEIRESALGFFSLALSAFVAMEVARWLLGTSGARPDGEQVPELVVVALLAGLTLYFAACSLWLCIVAWRRPGEREDAILRARIPLEAPPELSGSALVSWVAMRGEQPEPPPDRSLEEILGVDVASVLLVLGVSALLGGAGAVAWAWSHGAAIPWTLLGLSGLGAATIALALRVDRARERR